MRYVEYVYRCLTGNVVAMLEYFKTYIYIYYVLAVRKVLKLIFRSLKDSAYLSS